MIKFKNKTILITGGTGSFGTEFVNFLLDKQLKEIRIFSRDELKQEELRIKLNRGNIRFYIGDIRDLSSIDSVMHNVDYVFHAAALKQVPSCEFFPREAVLTNVNGSENVIKSAVKHNVKSIVCLSTDKAVYPINVMGMTKALMEKTALAISKNDTINTTINIVRYGNVLFSRGSVLPLFVNQIINNKPITITSEKMTRFLLPLDQAVDLVSYALTNGHQGDLFIRKSISANIMDIVEALEKIYNKKIKIKNIGIRHGEKIDEILASGQEMAKAKNKNNYYIIPSDKSNITYNHYFIKGKEYNKKIFKDYSSGDNILKNKKALQKLLKKELYKYNYLK